MRLTSAERKALLIAVSNGELDTSKIPNIMGEISNGETVNNVDWVAMLQEADDIQQELQEQRASLDNENKNASHTGIYENFSLSLQPRK